MLEINGAELRLLPFLRTTVEVALLFPGIEILFPDLLETLLMRFCSLELSLSEVVTLVDESESRFDDNGLGTFMMSDNGKRL